MKLKLSREFKIGFFGILMIAALYWGVNFLKGTDLFTSSVHYYAAYDQVNGLQPSAAVVIKGYKVGTISDISYDPQRSNNVVVEFAIKSKFKIPKDTKARIFSDGIMGGKSIELELGRSDAYLHEGDTLFSEINKDFLEVAGSEFEFLKQRANDVISEMIVTLRGINKLLSDNSANLNATIGNVAAITGDLRSVVADEKGSLRETISNVNDLSRTLRDKTGQIDRIFTNVERFSDSLSQSRIPTLVAQMNGTLAELNRTLAKVNDGDGTVGKFVNDQALYDSLVQASSNLSTIESMWLMIAGNPLTSRHNSRSRGYFSSSRPPKKATSAWTVESPLRSATISSTSRNAPMTAAFFRKGSVSTKLPSGNPLSSISAVRIS